MRHVAPRARRRRRRRRALLATASALSIAAAVLSAGNVLDIEEVGLSVVSHVEALASNGSGGPADRREQAAPSAPPARPATKLRAVPTLAPADPPREAVNATPATVTPTTVTPTTVNPAVPARRTPDVNEPLPAKSGHGKRIVYTLKTNHVWLVAANGNVVRDYLVSGTRFDQVEPGTYEVLRKRRHTTSFHGTESMEYMVTFTEGENAAIGFHDIPISLETGTPIQTLAQLGKSLSAGCVRQAEPDARALWEFAPVGTTVVVLP